MPTTAFRTGPAVRSFEDPTKSKQPVKLTKTKSIKPKKLDAGVVVHDLTERHLHRHASTLIATAGRDAAIRECREKVEMISSECRLRNVKYRDPHFDLSERAGTCLYGLHQMADENDEGVHMPGGIKRVGQIFDNPKFIVDGIDAGDIKQGAAGDCWFLAAIATIANKPELLESICVARDEVVGVYGFIFFRDGDWISEVVDDQLFIAHGDYYHAPDEVRRAFASEQQYVQSLQRGSNALVYAHCEDSNETWLPLLEKAFAKVHGDYSAIEAGFTGEGVEDLTGGVTSEVICSDILDKDHFWTNELMHVNKELLFAGGIDRLGVAEVRGILTGHAYSVLRAVEANGKRFVQVRNPWGKTEWTGPWSDGSAEWTAEWITILNHKFGDDGSFWMSYEDFLETFTVLDRTRIFSSEWSVAQCWTRELVQWPNKSFAEHEFRVSLEKDGPVVIVLRQADTRYFQGLEGQFDFQLHFRVRREGERKYFARSSHSIIMSRSVSMELPLTAGVWRVSYKIRRQKRGRASRTDYINEFREKQSDKFMEVAINFDYALNLHVVHGSKHELEDGDEIVAVPVPEVDDIVTEQVEEEEVEEEAEPEMEKSNQEEEEQEEAVEEEEHEEEEEEGEQDEEEAAKAKRAKEQVELLDAIVVVGIRVHAQDPGLQVSLVKSAPTTSDWALDPDDSIVKRFHARTGGLLASISQLAK
ncbi:hypothetical protein Poli38472_012654 [Pythium oligandrum]|uniref:Calpain catalytic domain-containing protein n=1 Tax=Pythium oligandrum TaxID=41045 RepID=A0A8K1CF87_PYTOL|nr:hypothetical protein Poli38472_012654 [Pythium oligandrum]|eukprot:TMW61463.1 hypothetical protein Poli38472_012654 [Pythium oligandrum]